MQGRDWAKVRESIYYALTGRQWSIEQEDGWMDGRADGGLLTRFVPGYSYWWHPFLSYIIRPRLLHQPWSVPLYMEATLNPTFMTADPLPPPLREALLSQGITRLFPLQRSLLRAPLDRDICLCAPTGSGKTLAYLLPMLMHLSGRRLVRLRALIVVPGRELAVQVATVLEPLARSLGLRVALAIGQTSMTSEARRLVRGAGTDHVGDTDDTTGTMGTAHGSKRDGGALTTAVDILVATPGRLLDHLESTRGFTLEHVEYLILDEADRLLEGFTQDWLPSILASIMTSVPGLTSADPLRTYRRQQQTAIQPTKEELAVLGPVWITPLRKILASATLTRNPAKLVGLDLHKPMHITAADVDQWEDQEGDLARCEGEGLSISDDRTFKSDAHTRDTAIGAMRVVLPRGLSEFMYVCEEARKPAAIIYLVEEAQLGGPSLCFTRSVEATRQLTLLLTRACPHRHIAAYSADLSPERRASLLRQFAEGQLDLLVCSDAAARGLDLPGVAAVINYDAPRHLRTYVHRVGRTARAGRAGRAYTILSIREAHHFKQMMAKRRAEDQDESRVKGQEEKREEEAKKGEEREDTEGRAHVKGDHTTTKLIATLRIPKTSLQRIVPLVEQSLEQRHE